MTAIKQLDARMAELKQVVIAKPRIPKFFVCEQCENVFPEDEIESCKEWDSTESPGHPYGGWINFLGSPCHSAAYSELEPEECDE